ATALVAWVVSDRLPGGRTGGAVVKNAEPVKEGGGSQPPVRVNPDTPLDGAVQAVKWNVLHYQPEGVGQDDLLGTLGVSSAMTRFEDKVVIDAELPRPAYAYLVAFNFDGKE